MSKHRIKRRLYLSLVRPTLNSATPSSEKLPQIPGTNKSLMMSNIKRLPTQPKLIQQGPLIHLPLDSIPTFLHNYWVSSFMTVILLWIITYSIPSVVWCRISESSSQCFDGPLDRRNYTQRCYIQGGLYDKYAKFF